MTRFLKLSWLALALVAGSMVQVGARAEPPELDAVATALVPALDAVCTNPELHQKALSDPAVLLDLAGTTLPEGLELTTFATTEMPFEPTWPTIELTHCRKTWVCEGDVGAPCKWRLEEYCLGFRVIDYRWPGPVFPPK